MLIPFSPNALPTEKMVTRYPMPVRVLRLGIDVPSVGNALQDS